MDRFLVKGALGALLGKREREVSGEGPAGLRGDEESSRKRPRAETPGNAGPLAGPSWRHIRAEGLSCDYTVLFGKAEADKIFQELEQGVEYFTGALARIQVPRCMETREGPSCERQLSLISLQHLLMRAGFLFLFCFVLFYWNSGLFIHSY